MRSFPLVAAVERVTSSMNKNNKSSVIISPRARELLDQFAEEFVKIVSLDAMDRLAAVLVTDGTRLVPKKNGAAASAKKKGKVQRRSTDELELAVSRLLQHVKANPGQNIEEIGKALRLTTRELTLPMQKLVNSKAVKTKGVKRQMKYSAG